MEKRPATKDSFDSLADVALRAYTSFAGKREFLPAQPGRGNTAMEFGRQTLARRAMALGVVPEQCDRVFEEAQSAFAFGSALCESPIERAVLAALITGPFRTFETLPPHIHDSKKAPILERGDLTIIPQMAFVRFRVDFMLALRTKLNNIRMIAIECDGEDFHGDVNKERAREGYLASWDIPLFRCTGKEIVADPHQAVWPNIAHADDLRESG
jgi:very-short-patch-repair endonuclease